MRSFMGLTKRNLLIYFKDKQSIFFSMLTPLIVFILYILFLKDSFTDPIMDGAKGLEDFISKANIDSMVSGLLLAGVMGSALITVAFNSLTTIVNDKENKIDYDICATPIKRVQIILSYFVASALTAFIMSSIILCIGLVLIVAQGSLYLTALDVIRLVGITLLGSLSATALFMIVMLFFKSSSASGAFFGILSAASGFVIGAYIPMSQFSDGMQTACNIIPGSGITIMLRNGILNPILDKINTDINGIDGGEFVSQMKNIFYFKARLFGEEVSLGTTLILVLVILVITIVAISVIYPRIYKRK